MEIIIWIIIAVVVIAAKSNKKKQDEARKKAQQSTAWNPTGMPDGSTPQMPRGPILPGEPRQPAAQENWPWPEDAAEGAASEYSAASASAQGAWPWPAVPAAGAPKAAAQDQLRGEGSAGIEEGKPQTERDPAPRHRPAQTTLKSRVAHTLRPASLSHGHAHMETSMTGEQLCPSVSMAADAAQPASARMRTTPAAPIANALKLDHEGIVTGLLYMEILGKPKALRQNRAYRS